MKTTQKNVLHFTSFQHHTTHSKLEGCTREGFPLLFLAELLNKHWKLCNIKSESYMALLQCILLYVKLHILVNFTPNEWFFCALLSNFLLDFFGAIEIFWTKFCYFIEINYDFICIFLRIWWISPKLCQSNTLYF